MEPNEFTLNTSSELSPMIIGDAMPSPNSRIKKSTLAESNITSS